MKERGMQGKTLMDFEGHCDIPDGGRNAKVHELAKACEALFEVIRKDEWERVAESLAGFDEGWVGAFDVLFKFTLAGSQFDGSVFDLALRCGSWRALGELVWEGMSRRRPMALKFMAALMNDIDKAPADEPDLPRWIEVAQRGAEPPDVECARIILGSPTLARLGPRSRAICVDAACRVVAAFEREQCEEAAAFAPDVGIAPAARMRL